MGSKYKYRVIEFIRPTTSRAICYGDQKTKSWRNAGCGWQKRGRLTRPVKDSARQHVRETGHTVEFERVDTTRFDPV